MAIQMRRGAYSDFDPTKMVAGEWAIVTSGDPTTVTGRAVYHCFVAGQVEKIASYTDAAQIIINAIPDTVDAITAAVEEAEGARVLAEAARIDAENARALAEQGRETAEAARVQAEADREAAQAQNNADQARNNEMAARQVFVELESGEYDPDTLKPTILGAAEGVIYLVPTDDTGKGSLDWRWNGTDFEPLGGYKFRIGYHVTNGNGYISIIEEG